LTFALITCAENKTGFDGYWREFGVKGVGFRVSRLEFRFEGLEYRVRD